MKRLLLTSLTVIFCYLAAWFLWQYIFNSLQTTIAVREGAVSVYYANDKGAHEYLGILHPGEEIVARSRNTGPFSFLNLTKMFVPQAVSIFKNTIYQLSGTKPVGVYDYFFTEADFEKYISSKIRNPLVPELTVSIGPEGFQAYGLIKLWVIRIPFSGSGIVRVDHANHGVLSVDFYAIKIGALRLPKFLLQWLANASNKTMGMGSYRIEILDMAYRKQGIDIQYVKVSAFSGSFEGRETEESAEQEAGRIAKRLVRLTESEDKEKVSTVSPDTGYLTLRNPSKDVFVRKRGGPWLAATNGMVILPGDDIRTAQSSVEILMDDGRAGHLELKEGSLLRSLSAKKEVATGARTTLLNLAVGKLLAKVEPLVGSSKFEVVTPTAISGVRGTLFEVAVSSRKKLF